MAQGASIVTGQADRVGSAQADRVAPALTTVVFDLGGVLVDWNPRHLYRSLIPDEQEMERFLREVCTPAWNAQMDSGRPWREAIDELVARHPAEAALIAAYDARWEEMLGDAFDGSVAVLADLVAADVPVFALTNWSPDKFRISRPRYPFLEWFRGIVVSGEEGVAKPDPALFRILFERYAIDPRGTVFVDDTAANLPVAASLGMTSLPFLDAERLRADLGRLGLLVAAPEH